jgi:GntR family transcriptional repressor for pyruvate dehydrogenase complex
MEIVEQLSAMVRNGVLTGGEKLPPERTLSAELGTGRQCLRESLSVLEVLGVIEVKKGRGTFVREDAAANLAASAATAEDLGNPFALMEARKTVEVRTAALAAKRAEAGDVEELEAILAGMEGTVGRGEHPEAEDKRLHLAIARASGNPVLHKLMSVIVDNMGKRLYQTLKERSLLAGGRSERYYEEHTRLVRAIKQGNARGAERIMLQHLNGIEQDLRG